MKEKRPDNIIEIKLEVFGKGKRFAKATKSILVDDERGIDLAAEAARIMIRRYLRKNFIR